MAQVTGLESEVEERTQRLAVQDAVRRAGMVSLVLATLFGSYGLTSIGFIQKFAPGTELWDNVWPRFIFSALPFLLLARHMKFGRESDTRKLIQWIVAFSVILHVAAWIQVWPIALYVSADILTYVHGANIFLFAIVFAGVAPPRKLLAPFVLILIFIFILPLFAVAYFSKDNVVFKLVISDSLMALGSAVFLNRVVDSLRQQLARLELERAAHASQFLGPVLSKAIFNNESARLERIRCRGFIVSIDVRDSTGLQQQFGQKWADFRREYFALVSKLVQKHEGYTQKTVGDCHVINFGIMDFGVDLSDIPGIEQELNRAEERRLQRASGCAFTFVDQLLGEFEHLSQKHFPNRPVRLGAGLDKGWVERGIQGDASHGLELDVNGDPVNCSNRLQEYSKFLREKLGWDASILVVSPFASDYLEDVRDFSRVMTVENSVRNYPGIKWVFVKRYSAARALDVEKAAA